MKPRCAAGLLLVSLAVSGTSCPIWPDPADNSKRIAALRGFGSGEELRAYLSSQANVRNTRSGGPLNFFGFGGFGLVGMAPSVEADANAEASTGSDEAPFSTTNLQEQGVDESDVVKNDGQYIYLLERDSVHIVQATPAASLTELATVKLETAGDSLYLRGQKLVALSQTGWSFYYDMPVAFRAEPAGSAAGAATLVGGDLNDGAQTTVTVIDVSNPAQPAVEATLKFEGSMVSSRMIDNLLYLVLTTTPRLPPNPIPLAIETMPLEDWIPDYEVLDGAGGSVASGDVAGWQDFYRPEDPDGYGIAMIITLDVTAPTSPFKKTAISADAGTIYASTEALYITDTDYSYTNSSSRADTAIHKLAFVPDGTAYVGSGLVPGRLLSQYSLGEHEGYIRVATTVEEFNAVGPGRQDNNVYVLGETDQAALEVVGRIEGIAPGEQIYSARFLGERGFLVTFRRVDPLYTLDLSDPTQPKIVGELKVPGYSDHIQLLDENHLLTIGKDAQDAGSFAWIQGVQLSIFDVADPANPALLHKEIIGGRGTHSEANTNPKAFNYFAPRHVLAFPLDVYTDSGQGGPAWGGHEFTGLYVYRVTVDNGFEFLGRITSDEGTNPRGCFLGYYGFTRGVFIGDMVYSVTERNVKASPLDAVGAIAGTAALSQPPPLTEDCFLGAPDIVMPFGGGLE